MTKTLKQFNEESSLAKNKEFVRKIYSKGYKSFGPGRLYCIQRKGDDDQICAKLVLEAYDGYVYFKELVILGEGEGFGKGLGTIIMNMLIKEADKLGVYIELTAEPLLTPGTKKLAMSQSKLINWYKKFGFRSHKFEARSMYRFPK